MPIGSSKHRSPPAFHRLLWLSIVAIAGAVFLLLPGKAEANTVCQVSPPTLDFGTSLTASGTISWTCRNFEAAPVSFTLCAAIGTPSYPGTAEQPKLVGSSPVLLNFNVYVDSAATQVWNNSTPLTTNVTVAGGGTASGNFIFYGRIPGSQGGTGSYSAFFYNTVIGFLTAGSTACQRNGPNLFGVDVTISVTANVVEGCTLGTIGDIDFGELAGLQDRIDAAGSVQLVCPPNRGWTLSFDGGRHAAGTERRMQSAAGDLIPYRLYRDPSRSKPIDIDGVISGAGTGGVDTVPVYGRVEIGTLPTVGQYADFIVVTLGF